MRAPDYRLRQVISNDPGLFGRRERTVNVQLGGDVLPPDASNSLSMSMWVTMCERRLEEHRRELTAIGVVALPVRDAEHRLLMLHALSSAKRRVCITSPHLGVGVLGSHVVNGLLGARSRNVDVAVAFNEERIGEAIRFAERRRELEGAGVKFIQRSTHAKVLVCDDWATVSSFNFLSFEGYYDNERRARHEFGVRVIDATVAERLSSMVCGIGV
jgi:phosphatidylserine/phosphatidylglycerophosphate/cardiolipin synthase-like enzyme